MKFKIKHEIKGRIRVRAIVKHMTVKEADLLEYALSNKEGITSVRVNERTADVVLCYKTDRATVLSYLRKCHIEEIEAPESYLAHSGRALNNEYWDKLVGTVVWRCTKKLFVPAPICTCITLAAAIPYIWKGVKTLVKGKLEVPVLDATAITISIARGDVSTASSVMFLLGIGEILEEWTHKKSVGDLARSMSLNVSKVWMLSGDQEVLVDASTIKEGDNIVVHMGNVIPFDGSVVAGEGMVNQASMTGESAAVRKYEGTTVYAGTVLEEGELTVNVKKLGGASRYEQIVVMIEESEKLKSSMEGKAERLADKLVPYTFLTTGLTYLFTRNLTKATSVLMVDFCCALKLSMPIAVLSAIKEARNRNVNVKGGKFLESIAEADTIVFDKTGTMTQGVFEVSGVHHSSMDTEKLLEYAALAECHSSHPISKSLKKAYGKPLDPSRVTDVEEISGNGVTAKVDGVRVAAGNSKLMEKLGVDCMECHSVGTVVHMAVNGKYAGHILISDQIKPHAKEAIAALKKCGVKKTIMLTGDRREAARQVAEELGIDEVHSELLPGDKVAQVEKLLDEKGEKEKLAFVGDGINDAPVLSRADIGIAMGALGSDAAIEAADIVLMDDDPLKISKAIRISRKCLRIVYENIYFAIGVKVVCLILGALGIANMWAAIFADVGVMIIAVLNAIRALNVKKL